MDVANLIYAVQGIKFLSLTFILEKWYVEESVTSVGCAWASLYCRCTEAFMRIALIVV